MSDEQTRLLQQILEVQQEHLAFMKQHAERSRALSEAALAGQSKGIRAGRIFLVVVFIALMAFLAITVVGAKRPHPDQPVHARELPLKAI